MYKKYKVEIYLMDVRYICRFFDAENYLLINFIVTH